MAVDSSCLYSTVVNRTGQRRHFGFLPPHGKTLEANEEYTVFGHIQEAVVKDVERVTSKRHMVAFERAVENGDIDILATPAPILHDTVTHLSKMLKMTSGTLGTADPCWTGDTDTDLEPV